MTAGHDPGQAEPVLTDKDLERIADAVAERLGAQQGWIDVRAAAAYAGVSVDTAYAHAEQWGAVRVGNGRRARLRFRRDLIDAGLAPSVEPSPAPKPRRQRPARTGPAPRPDELLQPRQAR